MENYAYVKRRWHRVKRFAQKTTPTSNKRAQITTFIIVGLFILIIIGLALSVKKEQITKKETKNENVETFVTSCLDAVSHEAFRTLGIQGGYLSLDYDYIETETYNTTYLYYVDENRIPTMTSIEDQIETYIETTMETCADFASFEGTTFNAGEKQARVTVGEEDVAVELFWDITISKDDTQSTLNNFHTTLNIPFMDVYTTVENIVAATEQHPDIVDNLLLVQQNVTFIDYVVTDNYDVVYRIEEQEEGMQNPYYFLFAVKTDSEGLT